MGTILFLVFLLNLFSFFLCGYDKRCSIKKKRRIPEKAFFVLSFLGGSIGFFFGMYCFHHKTKKNKFRYGIPFLIFVQLGIILKVFLWKS